MDTHKDSFPFPQADNMNKIILLLNLEDEELLLDRIFLSRFLGGISQRQVSYYTSAMKYLGLMTRERKYTPRAIYMRGLSTLFQNIELARIVISDPLLARVYFMEKALETKLEKEDIIEVMREFISLGSDEMYRRRSQTVIGWISWINDLFNDRF